MRAIKTFNDVQTVIRQIYEQIKIVSSNHDWDFKNLRIKNASAAVDPNDYVILSQLQAVSGQTPVSTTSSTTIIGGSPLQQLQVDFVLIAGSNTINSPTIVNVGDKLTIFLTTPGSGTSTIVWDSGFELVSVNDIDQRINKTSCYRFEARGDGKWALVAPPLLGRP